MIRIENPALARYKVRLADLIDRFDQVVALPGRPGLADVLDEIAAITDEINRTLDAEDARALNQQVERILH